MSLEAYRRKRDFRSTSEPKGEKRTSGGKLAYVVQKHDASSLHYDFRIEWGGVLKSWAVPKGPSLDPSDKRLAVQVEDHPLEYGDFEGVIPEDEYGAGTVMVWDRGHWEPQEDSDPDEGLENGSLKLTLHGEKLRGGWALVQMKGRGTENWLLIKERDRYATEKKNPVEDEPESAKSGRTMGQIASEEGGDADTDNGGGNPGDPSKIDQARKKKQPKTLKPQLASLVKTAPEGDQWLHEIKYDGYRILCHLEDGKARLLTRQGKDWTERFEGAAEACEQLGVGDAIIDGEMVVLDDDGRSDFQLLQNAMKGKSRKRIVYYVFDLPHCEGYDLTRAALRDRKDFLSKLVGKKRKGTVRFSDHIEGSGPDAHEEACKQQLEGIISKRVDRGYAAGKRTPDWKKVKCLRRQEFVIGGFTEPQGSRKGFGALLLGYYANGDFIYAGRVGTGFDDDLLEELRGRLDRIERKTPPFEEPPGGSDAKGAHWVTPKLVGEVAFTEWTDDGRLRHPAFQGLRDDKPAKKVRRETPAGTSGVGKGASGGAKKKSGNPGPTDVEGVRLTHPDKVLYPEQGLTKRELAAYYIDMADWVLPHVAGRPLTLVRCPDGPKKECFYQKHVTDSMPDAVNGVGIAEKNETRTYITVDDVPGLVALVQMGALELHPWGSRNDRVDRPDRLIFDLDPGEGAPWEAVVEGAAEVRRRLEDLGLECFLKTSGGKGLHVMAPIDRRSTWDEAKGFTAAIAKRMARDRPDTYVATASKAKRKGKVYVDYLRNARGATSVAAYSSRARPGATVSMPLRWDELGTTLDPAGYTVKNARQRLEQLEGDPWKGFFDVRQSITKGMLKEVGAA